MDVLNFIEIKKAGGELSAEQIDFWIDSLDALPDYQVSALLMAITLRGFSDAESAALTYALARSGRRTDLSRFGDLSADKHSTGGVGDTTSLIVVPVLAACGLTVAKASGRGLGHTGGTLDKLESVPGFRVDLEERAFLAQAERIGMAIRGAGTDFCPADHRLYALRDVTGTVDSTGLIAASVMSKKLAGGAKNIVLDVKCGAGAFMKDPCAAAELALRMTRIGSAAGKNAAAVVTAMDAPLGRCVGNAVEVYGALRVLKGMEKGGLWEVSAALCEELLRCAGIEDGQRRVREALESGDAYENFARWVGAQGGDTAYVQDERRLLGYAPIEVRAANSGYIRALDAMAIARAVGAAGGGRRRLEDAIDPYAGVILEVTPGAYVSKGDLLARVFAAKDDGFSAAVAAAIEVGAAPESAEELILQTVRADRPAEKEKV